MQIKINEISNGYIVDLDTKDSSGRVMVGKTSVYKSTDVLVMIEEIGRLVYGKKVKVVEK